MLFVLYLSYDYECIDLIRLRIYCAIQYNKFPQSQDRCYRPIKVHGIMYTEDILCQCLSMRKQAVLGIVSRAQQTLKP